MVENYLFAHPRTSIAIIDATVKIFITYIGMASSDMEKMADRAVKQMEVVIICLDGEQSTHKTNDFMARLTCIIDIYIFIKF